ncbi:MAG TPA: phosphate ABC transporter permease PstA [Chthoniobacterales bacterium]
MHAPANKFQAVSSPARKTQAVAFWLCRIATYAIVLCATYIFADILVKGGAVVLKATPPFINLSFLTESPETLYIYDKDGKEVAVGDRAMRRDAAAMGKQPEFKQTFVYSAGGIFPCIVGTFLLVLGSMGIALFLGVASAIYLSEYSRDGWFIRWVRLAIINLSGVPSIVFGLFGFGMLVILLKWNVSLMAGWFTLAFMVLPVIITASEESLRAVPKGFREGSLALGATKWQTIWKNVLPYALPGVLTSSILSIARVAGETAPIMFTAAYVVRDSLPWQIKHLSEFFFQGVMALPYHIYVVSAKIPQNAYTAKVQYGTAFVFLFLVMAIALASVLMRMRLRKMYRW